MIEFIGWTAFICIGAYVVGYGTMIAVGVLSRRGLDALASMILWGAIAAMSWIAFALWLSPLTIAIK